MSTQKTAWILGGAGEMRRGMTQHWAARRLRDRIASWCARQAAEPWNR